jgi:hypothetical protein
MHEIQRRPLAYRNETDAGRRVPCTSDRDGDFMSRELSTLSGLGALGHFDLNFIGVGQVIAGEDP